MPGDPDHNEVPLPPLVARSDWEPFATRLAQAREPHEQLAIAGLYLLEHEHVVAARIGGSAPALVDSHEAARIGEYLASLRTDASDEEAAAGLVQSVAALDRHLGVNEDEGPKGPGWWGPYSSSVVGDEILVLRWSRPATLPIDRQGLASDCLTRHRILGPTRTGLAWDLAELGYGSDQAVVVRQLLGRRSWPLRVVLWPGLPFANGSDLQSEDNCAVVGPTSQERSDEIVEDVLAAVKLAERAHAHVLVLPELYLPADRLNDLVEVLGNENRSPHPVLTTVGLAHVAASNGWLNRAVVLDYQGGELWSHHKLTPFRLSRTSGECLQPGTVLALRSSSVGWLATVICLDAFAGTSKPALLQAAPSLVLVPSLSNRTTAHGATATEALARGSHLAVANRPIPAGADAPSFFGSSALASPKPVVVEWAPDSGNYHATVVDG